MVSSIIFHYMPVVKVYVMICNILRILLVQVIIVVVKKKRHKIKTTQTMHWINSNT